MPDSSFTRKFIQLVPFPHLSQFTNVFLTPQPAIGDGSQAGGIITPVFQLLKRTQQNGGRLSITDKTDYATHPSPFILSQLYALLLDAS
jgi:hypothetical protein